MGTIALSALGSIFARSVLYSASNVLKGTILSAVAILAESTILVTISFTLAFCSACAFTIVADVDTGAAADAFAFVDTRRVTPFPGLF